jgi:TetR/AcrR family transcriptional regulator, cholesterol catabolism regulator
MAPDRKTAIRTAALELFSAKGYEATSMRDLAEAVGVQPASLYTHFRGKEDLLMFVIDEASAKFESRWDVALADPSEPVLVRLRRALRAHVEVITENLAAATVFLHEWRSLDARRRRKVLGRRDRYERRIVALLEEGVANGELRSIDVHLTTTAFFSLANGVHTWYRPTGSLDADEIADRFFDLLVGGIAATLPAVVEGAS